MTTTIKPLSDGSSVQIVRVGAIVACSLLEPDEVTTTKTK